MLNNQNSHPFDAGKAVTIKIIASGGFRVLGEKQKGWGGGRGIL